MIRSLRRFLVNSVAGAFAILPLAVGAATTGYTSKASFNAAVVSLAVALTHFDDKSVEMRWRAVQASACRSMRQG